jgi:hypothetical protein
LAQPDAINVPCHDSYHGQKKAPNSGEGWALCVFTLRREGNRR